MPIGSWSLQNNLMLFEEISSDDPIAEVIKEAFDMDLEVSGGWGYRQENAIILPTKNRQLAQLQHTLASMRTHLEMSLTQPEHNRYGGINLNELSRITTDNPRYEAVTYRVTAMLASDYADFINAYKKGYGTESFDMEARFQARKEATLTRDITVWFGV